MDRVKNNPTEVKTVPERGPTETALAPAEVAQELELAERAEQSLIERLKRLENYAVIFQRRAELIETCHLSAIKRTRPEDWVLFKDREGGVIGMLTGPGADLVAEVYGIVIDKIGPTNERGEFEPERTVYRKGAAYGLRGYCRAFSRVNGRGVEYLEAEVRSDEDFTGRRLDESEKFAPRGETAAPGDLRSALLTRLRTKTVRVLCGMTRVPNGDLERAWKGTDKKVEGCRKGHGYGTSAERTVGSVAESDVPAEAEKLRAEILRRVGGDETGAKELLREISAGKDFKGFTSTKQMTQGWQVENAWKRLREHKTFGDAAQRQPGEDDK